MFLNIKKNKERKKGISLITLIITIIVIIILAAAVILSLNNTNIIKNANKSVELQNLDQVRDYAFLTWSDAKLKGDKTRKELEDIVIKELKDKNVDLDKYKVEVSKEGIIVDFKNPEEDLVIDLMPKDYKDFEKVSHNLGGNNVNYYRVSDLGINIDDLIGSILTVEYRGKTTSNIIGTSWNKSSDSPYINSNPYYADNKDVYCLHRMYLYIVSKDDSASKDPAIIIYFPKKGIYIDVDKLNKVGYTKIKITIPNKKNQVLYSGDLKLLLQGFNKYRMFIIPEKLDYRNGERVSEISSECFRDELKLEKILIPKTINKIDNNAFAGTNNLKDVYYTGTEAEWNSIIKGTGNNSLVNATIHYNYDITKEKTDINSLKVGSLVKYNPLGKYLGNKEYYQPYAVYSRNIYNKEIKLIDGVGEELLDSSKREFNISNWLVYEIDKKLGKVKLVPIRGTIKGIRFVGSQGYNNYVKILNDACNSLYGDNSKGIEARSINILDIESKMTDEALNIAHTYKSDSGEYGKQQQSPYTKYIKYPIIYSKQKKSVIDGKENLNGLTSSEQDRIILKSESEEEKGYLTAKESIQPYSDYWCLVPTPNNGITEEFIKNNMYKNDLESGMNYYDIFNATSFTSSNAIATRSNVSRAFHRNQGIGFTCFKLSSGKIYNTAIFTSDGHNDFSLVESFYPIVTLDSSLLEGNDLIGFKVK